MIIVHENLDKALKIANNLSPPDPVIVSHLNDLNNYLNKIDKDIESAYPINSISDLNRAHEIVKQYLQNPDWPPDPS